MLNRTRSKTGLAVVALLGALPLLLTTPTANAKTPQPRIPVKPVQIDYGGNPSGWALGAAGVVLGVVDGRLDMSTDITQTGPIVQLDPPPDPLDIADPLPDPNAPNPVPYVTVDGPASAPETAASAADTTCTKYGIATWWDPGDHTCPPLHWDKGVWFLEDHTGAAWPVHAAADAWNNSTANLHIYYGCPSSYHCVKVVEGKYGATGWGGQTVPGPIGPNHTFTSMTIKMNNSYRWTRAQAMQEIVHELGHSAGLGHDTKYGGPMDGKTNDGRHQLPIYDEKQQLDLHTYKAHGA